jgi:hypothetical protein
VKSELRVIVGSGDGYSYQSVVDLYESLILGKPLPGALVLPNLQEADRLLAAVLFLDRSVLIHENVAALVYHASLIERHGIWALAHMPEAHTQFFLKLQRLALTAAPENLGQLMADATAYTRDLLDGDTGLVAQAPAIEVIEVGPVGYVAAESKSDPLLSWVQLFRRGFLQGALLCGKSVTIAKKSGFVGKDLGYTKSILEQATGQPWTLSGLVLTCASCSASRADILRLLRPAPMTS